MSVADWYLYKAQQCARRADAATDVRTRTALVEEAAHWRQLARAVAREETQPLPTIP
jgi:hypothetical protein